jgi:hypothetical protein
MAKILLGGLAQDVRGSQNGLTFARNKGGAYVRAKVSPVQPRTPAQLAVRANLAQGSKNYSALLTDDERAAWAGFANANTRTNVFGNTTHLSALQWYVGLNQVLAQIGSARITTPPIDLGVPENRSPGAFSTDETPTVTMQFNAGAVGTGVEAYIFATAPQAAGKVPQASLYRFIQTASLSTSSTVSNVDISTAYIAKWGAPITGKKIYALVSNVNTESGATTVGQKITSITS